MRKRLFPTLGRGPGLPSYYASVWTEFVGGWPPTFWVICRRFPPVGNELKRMPHWWWKHGYYTICATQQEAEDAFMRRVSDLRVLDVRVERHWRMNDVH